MTSQRPSHIGSPDEIDSPLAIRLEGDRPPTVGLLDASNSRAFSSIATG